VVQRAGSQAENPVPHKLLNGPRSWPPKPALAASSPARSATVILAEGMAGCASLYRTQ